MASIKLTVYLRDGSQMTWITSIENDVQLALTELLSTFRRDQEFITLDNFDEYEQGEAGLRRKALIRLSDVMAIDVSELYSAPAPAPWKRKTSNGTLSNL
jgi:hypothetical protein